MKEPRNVGPVTLRPQKLQGELTGRWFADIPPKFTDNGARRRKLFDKYSSANEFAEQFCEHLRNAVSGGAGRPFTFRDLSRRWTSAMRDLVAVGKKRASTLETDLYRMKPLVAYFGSLSVDKIVEEKVVEYQDKRLNRDGYAAYTVQGEMAVLRKIFHWGRRNKILKEVPEFSGVPVEVDETEPLSLEEALRIIMCLPARLRPLIRLFAETGCRKSEAFGLIWDHVNLEEGYVVFKKTRRRQLKTKYSTRKVYLGEGVKEQLRLLRPQGSREGVPVEQQYVFPGRKPGQPLDNVKKALKTAVKQANVRRDGQLMNVTLRSFRKAYGSWLDNGMVPDSVIQSNLGHAPGSTVTRKHYLRAYDESKKQAVIDLDVPLSTQKKNGRWQSKPKIWQSMATHT